MFDIRWYSLVYLEGKINGDTKELTKEQKDDRTILSIQSRVDNSIK